MILRYEKNMRDIFAAWNLYYLDLLSGYLMDRVIVGTAVVWNSIRSIWGGTVLTYTLCGRLIDMNVSVENMNPVNIRFVIRSVNCYTSIASSIVGIRQDSHIFVCLYRGVSFVTNPENLNFQLDAFLLAMKIKYVTLLNIIVIKAFHPGLESIEPVRDFIKTSSVS